MMPAIRARPFDFPFQGNSIGLLVIDMQRDFVEPGGFGESLGNNVAPLRAIIPTVQRLLVTFRGLGLPIIHTRECHKPDLSDCPPAKRDRGNPDLRIGDEGPMGRLLISDAPGAAIIPDLSPIADEVVIDKPGKGAFYATDLDAILRKRGLQHLILAGVTTEVCVQTTMREANDRGYDCLLVTDATASYFPEFHAATVAMVTAQGGIVGWAASSDEVVEALGG